LARDRATQSWKSALLLRAGELLWKEHATDLPDDLDAMANLVADFLPTFEIGSFTDPYMLFLRFYIYVSMIFRTFLPICRCSMYMWNSKTYSVFL
jgi:hypothetical protein